MDQLTAVVHSRIKELQASASSDEALALLQVQELALELVSEIGHERAEGEDLPTQWGAIYDATLLAGEACVRAETSSQTHLASAFLSIVAPELHPNYRNVPVAAWVALLLKVRGKDFDRTSWIALHAFEWMKDPWGLQLLKSHGLPGERDRDFDWLGIYPGGGLDAVVPGWDNDHASDFMAPADSARMLWKGLKKKPGTPLQMAAGWMFEQLSTKKAASARAEWQPQTDWIEKYLPRLKGKVPDDFHLLFRVPESTEQLKCEPLEAWLRDLSVDELRTLLFLAMSESAYVYRIQAAFHEAHPKDPLLPKKVW